MTDPNPVLLGELAEVDTVEALLELMRRAKAAHGMSYRQAQHRAARRGHVLPHSTLASALSRSALPRAEVVSAFAAACGYSDEEIARWREVWQRLAHPVRTPVTPAPAPAEAGAPSTTGRPVTVPAPRSLPGRPPADTSDPGGHESVRPSPRAHAVPPRSRRLVAAVGVVVTAAAVALLVWFGSTDQTPDGSPAGRQTEQQAVPTQPTADPTTSVTGTPPTTPVEQVPVVGPTEPGPATRQPTGGLAPNATATPAPATRQPVPPAQQPVPPAQQPAPEPSPAPDPFQPAPTTTEEAGPVGGGQYCRPSPPVCSRPIG